MYLGPLLDEQFVKWIKAVDQSPFPGVTSWAKVNALMHGLLSDFPEVPLFFSLRSLAGCLKISPPKLRVFRVYIEKLGYRVGGRHRTPNVIKTDAPSSAVFDLRRLYFQPTAVEGKEEIPKLMLESVTTQIPDDLQIDWSIKVDDSREAAIYLPNPKANWGPKQRAAASEGNSAKRRKLVESKDWLTKIARNNM
jgi:tRNA (guanine26-N2/guanine27-N2)-dimethyltransferase